MQPPKTHFLTFSKVKKTHCGEKSETKIMKMTHSAMYHQIETFSFGSRCPTKPKGYTCKAGEEMGKTGL